MRSPRFHRSRLRPHAHAPIGAGMCMVIVAASAQAQDAVSGSVALTSDYRVRGLSQTNGEPAVQGGVHANFDPGWFIGVWTSTIDRNRGPSASLEVDGYAGFAWSFAEDWAAKLTFTHYWYPDDPLPARYDYDELSASLAYRGQLVATATWSPNTTHFGYYRNRRQVERGATLSYELTGFQPLTALLGLTAGIGYHDLQELFGAGYWYWNLGLSCTMGPLRFDLSHIDSDGTAQRLFGKSMTNAGWTAAVSWRF